MDKIIKEKLIEIENLMDIKILLAVESGSRAWGFSSSDSDFDVRFVYVRKRKEYLSLQKFRDVIELPINNELDINGWDLDKTLRLLYKSNPTLFEWLSSPIIYKNSDSANNLRKIQSDYFSVKKSLYHYIGIANRNFNCYLINENVILKKYFYSLRPILACRWILQNKTQPPMLFSHLVQAQLPNSLKSIVNQLLDLKINSPEIKIIKSIPILQEFILTSIDEFKEILQKLPDEKQKNWDELNDFFIKELVE